jgi:hypothetical protein
MPNENGAPRYFHAHADWWVRIFGLLIAGVFVGAIPLIIWGELELWQRVLIAGISLLLAVNAIDKIFFMVYELGPEGLAIHTQLRKAFVAYRDMNEIKPGGIRSLVTTKRRKRFALSRRNIVISITDPLWSEISISPQNSEVFLDQLLATIDSERSRRATVSKRRN